MFKIKIMALLHTNPQRLWMIRIVNFLFDKIIPVAEHVPVCSRFFPPLQIFLKAVIISCIRHTDPLTLALCGIFILGSEKRQIQK